METFWIILITATCLVLFYLYYTSPKLENLRIQGSHDIRGDPVIIPRTDVGPWNIGSSSPKYNRRMIME